MTPLDALYRCQRAWEATQPQLFMELWPDASIDVAGSSPARSVTDRPVAQAVARRVVEHRAVTSPTKAGEMGAPASRDCSKSGLDETHVPARPCVPGAEAAVRLVEPAPAYRLTAEARGGLNNGAEPRWDLLGTDGRSFPFPAPPVSIPPEVGRVGSPNNQTGPDATPAKGARPAQRRSF